MKINGILRQNNLWISFECKIRLKTKIQSCETSIKQLQSTLKSLKSKIPNIINRIKDIQDQIDLHHDNVNKATVVGSSVGLLGGGLMIGGIIAAPFTFGASLGLTITGAIVGAAGGMTTAGAKVFDHFQSEGNNTEVMSLVNTVESLCKKAQDQYRNIERCCTEIGDILARNNVSLHAVTNWEKFITGWNVVSFVRAPPSVTVTITLGITSGTFRLGETAASTAIRALTITMKTVGGIFVGLGILADVYSLGKSIKELVTDAKCPVSEAISDQIRMLRTLQNDITKALDSL